MRKRREGGIGKGGMKEERRGGGLSHTSQNQV